MRSSCINFGLVLPLCICFSALAWWTCRIAIACRAEAAWPTVLSALAARAADSLQALDRRRERFLHMAVFFFGHRCTATALSTWGMSTYPLAAPPSRVVRKEEEDEWLLAMKGAVHDFVISSCTSRKKGTVVSRVPCRETNHPAASTQGWTVYSPSA